jgi:hypothetical protein
MGFARVTLLKNATFIACLLAVAASCRVWSAFSQRLPDFDGRSSRRRSDVGGSIFPTVWVWYHPLAIADPFTGRRYMSFVARPWCCA